ncbi:nicotinate-nucleotide--dimethylbenzimidazole phosphoribosyltransferase [Haloplanus litoreus]|uniref:nicotinate-nucleotide--dimethylbenzimidazole phosphoribosyltransferase n=1 Tax=Haloplanus litoreus TaxID=767515 RepID=UPI0036412ECD
MTRFVLVAGTTETAKIDGISAAGADPDLRVHTPSADAELIEYGHLVRAPVVPVSPTGCPTPAAVTRAVRERVGFETLVVDADLVEPTGAPTVGVGATPGRDVRDAEPVPTAPGAWVAARDLGRNLPDDELVVGETIPGGTTTALGVCRALGVAASVSSSLPQNPVALKREVIETALAASDLDPGEAAFRPRRAVRLLGDPVLAVVAGLTAGALESGTDVILGGGTQLLAAAALVRHAGVAEPLTLASTTYVADDVDLATVTADLDCDLVVTDPSFDGRDDALARYADGEAKEGAGMGGALLLADRANALDAVADGTLEVMERIGTPHEP